MRWIAYALPTLRVSTPPLPAEVNVPTVLSVGDDDAHVPPEPLAQQLAEGVDVGRVRRRRSVVVLRRQLRVVRGSAHSQEDDWPRAVRGERGHRECKARLTEWTTDSTMSREWIASHASAVSCRPGSWPAEPRSTTYPPSAASARAATCGPEAERRPGSRTLMCRIRPITNNDY